MTITNYLMTKNNIKELKAYWTNKYKWTNNTNNNYFLNIQLDRLEKELIAKFTKTKNYYKNNYKTPKANKVFTI